MDLTTRRTFLAAVTTAVTASSFTGTAPDVAASPEMDADGWPACDRKPECRFMATGSRSTLLAWAPTIDRNGNVSGKNPNTTTTDYTCMTCGKRLIKTS